MIRSGLIVFGFMFSTFAKSTILPPNDLYLEDELSFVANITESDFNAITNRVIDTYKPIVRAHGAILSVNAKWTDSTVNASAQQSGSSWVLNMYGGLARRPEITRDGYTLVICHELGHQLGGFPLVSAWAADEGESDYFATQSCAPYLWSAQVDVNAAARRTVESKAKVACDEKWTTRDRQNLCYRIAMAGKSLASLLAALGSSGQPAFGDYDSTVVSSTNHSHPAAQCRLDTYLAGAICVVPFNRSIIPGKGKGSRDGELEANLYSCSERGGYIESSRPHCWFKRGI
jgi:hypothetical protein